MFRPLAISRLASAARLQAPCALRVAVPSCGVLPRFLSVSSVNNQNIELPDVVRLRERLEKDPRDQISKDEFLRICNDAGVEGGEDLLRSFHNAGVFLHYEHSNNGLVRNRVFLKPNAVLSAMDHALLDIAGEEKTREDFLAELEELRKEFATLDSEAKTIHDLAYKSADRRIWTGFSVVAFQTGVFARLTWWELSWDIMEPVTFFFTFSGVLFGMAWFAKNKQEYSYEGMRATLAARKMAKLENSRGFDRERYDAVQNAIAKLELDITRIQ